MDKVKTIGGMVKSVKGITKFVDSVSSLASSEANLISRITHKKSDDPNSDAEKEIKKDKTKNKKAQEDEMMTKQDESVLDSAAAMRNWLVRVQPEVPPAIAEAIKGQLYVLSFVQSPAMAGMAVDNLIFCLDKSIKASSNDKQKAFIRETFCSMIQNLMFIMDARLTYAINKSQEEAGALLTQAGELLDSTITGIASSVITPGMVIPKVANIFSEQIAKDGFFKKIGAWIGQKKELESKKAEYYTTISNMFKTLDRYSSLIGPSILICGMLERYRPMVLAYHKEQYEKDAVKRSGSQINTLSSIMISSGQLLDTIKNPKKIGENLKKAGNTIGKINSAAKYSIGDLQRAEKQLNADLKVVQKETEDNRKEIEDVKTQLEHTSALQLGKKKALRERIELLENNRDKTKKKYLEIENRLLQVQELIKQEAPILEELKKMDEEFQRITEAYAVIL